jgi:predicted metallopeptidase
MLWKRNRRFNTGQMVQTHNACCLRVVTVQVLYDYDAMTKEIAAVIQWTKKIWVSTRINLNQVFISGTFCGCTTGALAVMNPARD